MKKHLIIFTCLLVALFSLCFAISGSAAQSNDNTGEITVQNITTYYNNISSRVTTVVSAVESRLTQLYDLDGELLDGYISNAEALLEKLKANKNIIQSSTASASEQSAALKDFNSTYAALDELCNKIVTSSAESKVVSARSAWHRPCEKTYAEIKANVKTFKENGVNLLFVETLYHGCSAFKTSVTAFPYHPSLASTYKDTEKNVLYNDYLSAFVACCKDYGIEVHAWVENFYSGINANAGVVREHPEWIMYNDDGSILQRLEGGQYIFIDPANKEVQDTLINYYNDLFKKNPGVAGLNLDYIRYPVSNQSQDTGYTMDAMKGFYESLGKEFSQAQLADRTKMANKFKQLFNKNYLLGGQNEADANYTAWVKYRTQIITDFVCRIKNEVKEPNGIILSTAVFASIAESLDSKKQDWQEWFNNGWIDIATPMAYYKSYSIVQSNVETMISLGGNACLYYTGIASSYSGLPAWQNKEFIEASYKAGACGYVIFSSAQIIGHDDVQSALSSGVNRKWAVLPHAEINSILKASFADIIDKSERIYIPAGGMAASDKASLESTFGKIAEMPCDTAYDIYGIYQKVTTLAKTELKNYAKGYSYQRILAQLGELEDVLDARISMQLIREGRWNPELDSQRPDIEDAYAEPEIPETPDKPEDTETPDIPDNSDDSENSDTPSDSENSKDPDTPDNSEDSDVTDIPENEEDNPKPEKKLGFFARIRLAIINFFKKLFGIKK